MRTERDIRNQIAYAHDKGVEEGVGAERARIMENLRKKGFPEEEIAKLLDNRPE